MGVADLEMDGLNVSDGQGKAEILNKQFSSVFTNENLTNLPEMENNPIPKISIYKFHPMMFWNNSFR